MRSQDLGDRFAAATLFVATVAYAVSLPRYLGWADESYFLYEAKRIRDGEVMYRDIFQYVTPISSYVMAGVFWLFGTTMTTARVTMAVIHGSIAVMTFACARALSVSRSLALVAALAHVAIAQPAWPVASWHWFSTCVAAAVLLALLRARWAESTGVLGLGILCGILVGVQQQRGMPLTVAVGVIVVIDHLIDHWYGTAGRARDVILRLATFSVGVALIVAPLLLTFVYLSGTEAVYHALVRFPTENYQRATFRTGEGLLKLLTEPYAANTFPRLLHALPLVLVPSLLFLLSGAVHRRARVRIRQRTVLLVFGAVSWLSIWYLPDFIHIAFIAVPLFVCATEIMQSAIEAAPLPVAIARRLILAVAMVATAGLGHHLRTTMTAEWAHHPYGHETAFGHVDFSARWEPLLVDAIRERLQRDPSQEMFCYPNLAAPYLTTGGRNPTPFQHFEPRVFPARDFNRVLAILKERRVPYIVASPMILLRPDPVATFMKDHYESVRIAAIIDAGELPALWLYRRKVDGRE